MAISPTDFQVSLTPSPVTAVLGKTGDLEMSFSNISLSETAYNLSIRVILPNGVSYQNSSIPVTSITPGPNNTLILDWVNITDLAPNQVDYTIGLQLNADEIFRGTGLPVPFDIPLSTIAMTGTIDTMPRGNEPENEKIPKTETADLIPLRYQIQKSGPTKIPKGAGLLEPVVSPEWPYTYTLTVINNTREDSIVSLIDNLPNGVRYLDNFNVNGPDSAALSIYNVVYPSGTQDYTTIDWGTITLTASTLSNEITFDAAIWDNFTVNGIENSGSRIPHLTELTNTLAIDGDSGLQQVTETTNAMDATIDKFVTPEHTDVGVMLNYTLEYRVNQYDGINDFVITDTLADGQSYVIGSASIPPTSVVENPDGTTIIIWNLGDLAAGFSSALTFSSTVDATFASGEPVAANDSISNQVGISGTNATSGTPTPDQSNSATAILSPAINKTVDNYYYKNGTLKTYNVAAPGDFVEFTISYDASLIDAEQLNIYIDEYPPLNMGPLTGLEPVIYGGSWPTPFPPETVSPNGLRWYLTPPPVAGGSTWSATIRIPVRTDMNPFVGTLNNLAKLGGSDTNGLAYSDRAQVAVNFGEPNIQLTKSIDPNNYYVSPGETYLYSIAISNPQTLEGLVTDAYNMQLTDLIPIGMTWNGTLNTVFTAGVTFNPPIIVGQNVSMLVTHLPPDGTLILTYGVEIDASVGAGQLLTNAVTLSRPYSQPDNSYLYPGDPFKTSITREVVGVPLTKAASPTTALVGDDIQYTLTAVVPSGTIAYTPQFSDVLPTGQSYIGPATRQIPPAAPSPVSNIGSGQNVIFPVDPDLDASGQPLTIIYSFTARVTSAERVPPFSESQTNVGTFDWYTSSGFIDKRTITDDEIITVTTPNLSILKEQRNATLLEPYTTSDIVVNAGDVIHYRLTVTSNGASPAYDIEIADILDNSIAFGGIISGPTAGSITPPGPPPNATLTWNISQLNNGADPATVEFSVTFTNLPGAGQIIHNTAVDAYNSNIVNPVTYNTSSNQVTAKAPSLGIRKTSSELTANVGDIITYILALEIPPDVVAYDVIVTDSLPDYQSYAGGATRNFYPVIPNVNDKVVTFPTEKKLGSYDTTQYIIYTFKAKIDSANPPYPQPQTNGVTVTWNVAPQGPAADPITARSDILVNQQEPFRGINLEDIADSINIIQGDWLKQ